MSEWDQFALVEEPPKGDFSQFKEVDQKDFSLFKEVPTATPEPGLVAKGRTYGPVVGEFHHDAMFGPNGNALGPKDVALSPDYQKYYPLGSNVMLNGQGPYRVADSSFVGPGQPNQATVELRDTANPPAQVEITPAPGEAQPDVAPSDEATVVNAPPQTETELEHLIPNEIARNAVAAGSDTYAGLIPTTLKGAAELATPLTSTIDGFMTLGRIVNDVRKGMSFDDAQKKEYPEGQILADAAKTKAGSRERFAAGFSTVVPLLMAAGITKGLTKPVEGLLPRGPLKEVPPAFQGLPQIEEPNAPTNSSPTGAGPEITPSGTSPAQGQSNGPTAPNAGEAAGAGTVGAPAQAAPSEIAEPPLRVRDYEGAPVQEVPARGVFSDEIEAEKFMDSFDPNYFPQYRKRGDKFVVYAPIDAPKITEAPAQELPLAEKIKRVIKESGAEEQPPGSLNFQQPSLNFKRGSAFGKYFKSWADRLKAIPKFADSVARFAKSKPIKDQITGTYDGIDNRAAYAAGQAASNVRLNLPSTARVADEAATFVRQANGDKSGMLAKLNWIRGKGYDDVLDYAERNWDALLPAAHAARNQTDAVYNAEVAAGVDVAYLGGYVKGVYEDDLRWDLKNMALDAIRGRSGGSTTHLASKVFNDYAEAIQAGYKPRDLRLSVLTQSSVHNGLRLVNGRVWAESLGSFTMPDGKPVVVPMERIDRKTSTGEDTYLLRPPNGYKSLEVSPGSLSAVHEDAHPLIKKLGEGSSFPVLASKIAGGIKHNMLAFDIYHGSRFAQMQMAFEGLLKPSYHKGLAVLDYTDVDLPRAVKAGEISQKEADWAKAKRPIVEGGLKAGVNSGKISDALFQTISPLWPGAKATSNWIFGKLSRGIITQSYVYAFERNARIHPDWTDAQNHAYTAREVNTYYRNMGNQGLFQDKTAQDRARFLTFAPQWFEGKARSEGRGYGQLAKGIWSPTKGGNVAKGMGTGILAYFALNQVVNQLTRGQFTWDNPEHGHKLDAWIPDFMQGTNGFFHSPLGVFDEITHDVIKAHEHGTEAMSIPLEVGKSQLGPIYSVARDLSGFDFYGRPLHGYDRFAQAFADAAPVPVGLKNRSYAGAAERNLFSFAGAKITPAGSNVTNIYKLAGDFMAKNGIKVDHGNEPSKYAPLRHALQEGRSADAQTEYRSLLEQGPAYMPVRERVAKNKVLIAQAMQPDKFTPSSSIETHFRNSLTRDQLDIYNAAMKEKENVWQQFKTLPK